MVSTGLGHLLAEARNPIVRWEWIPDHAGEIWERTYDHLSLTVRAVVFGLVISSVLAAVVLRWRSTFPPINAGAAFLYTLPSLAVFAALIPWTGLSDTTALIALTSYTLLVLVRNIVAGFDAVPSAVREAAVAMGMPPWRRLVGVELPLAIPYIIAGLRVATVTTVGLVAVASFIGVSNLGRFILEGFRIQFWTPMVVGAVLSILLSLSLDLLLFWTERLLTPWARRRGVTG
jgi:osmoprotectant transport system permease protein